MKPLTSRLRILFAVAASLGLILISQLAHAEPTNGKLVSAVLGEALHDQKSMDYMAHAVLNRFRIRGDLEGVYGYKEQTHCKPERMAWRFKMKETVYQGQTHYYREIK